MTQDIVDDFFTIPQLVHIPYLIHGFGTIKWKETDFVKKPGWEGFQLVFLDQIHSDFIHSIDRIPKKNLKGDAMVTDIPYILLIIKTADCLPVLIVNESPRAIAAVHCGWRGTRKRVIQRAIQRMRDHYGCHPSSLLAALGPCIGSECYEVGENVPKSFKEEGHSADFFRKHPLRKGKHLFDLRKANVSQMVSFGIKKNNIFSIDICTHCRKDLASFRRDKNKTGRVLSFIGMAF